MEYCIKHCFSGKDCHTQLLDIQVMQNIKMLFIIIKPFGNGWRRSQSQVDEVPHYKTSPSVHSSPEQNAFIKPH